jgi:hypothetical protein
MRFVITDSEGNLLDSFDDELTAHLALREIAADDPDDRPFLLAYSDDGTPVGEAVTVDELPVTLVKSVLNVGVQPEGTWATSDDVIVDGFKVQGSRVRVSSSPKKTRA